MSTHSLDNQLEERLIETVATHDKQIRELRTLQQIGSDVSKLEKTIGVVLDWPSLLNGQRGIGVYTLANNQNLMVFAVPSITFYEDSVALGNEIGYGYARDANYEWAAWNDWGSSDGNNLKMRCYIVNKSGSTKHIVSVCDWRFAVSPDSYTAIT